jgi:hypothetical protein
MPMKTELTPQDLAKAIQFLKDNSIREDAVSLDRLVGWLNAPRLDQGLVDKYKRTYPLSVKREKKTPESNEQS